LVISTGCIIDGALVCTAERRVEINHVRAGRRFYWRRSCKLLHAVLRVCQGWYIPRATHAASCVYAANSITWLFSPSPSLCAPCPLRAQDTAADRERRLQARADFFAEACLFRPAVRLQRHRGSHRCSPVYDVSVAGCTDAAVKYNSIIGKVSGDDWGGLATPKPLIVDNILP